MGCMVVEGCLIGVGGVGGIVTCYMLHVTLSVRAIHGRGWKIGQRIVYINNILFIYTIL